ncbi:efflux transporter outer membrane subunit (plasmid) [Ralstonia sp. 25C]|uniref:efflux transporter outer membrane subunit n=1 Tax=Ralstonia sp. 25C TaxID=3447363 RepID=UPI003F74C925
MLAAVFAVLAVVALAGCVGPDQRAVSMRTPAPDALAHTLASAEPGPPGNTVWPTAHWVDVFADPQLSALVDEACANSPDLDVARARMAAAQAQLDAFGSVSGLAGTATASVMKARAPQVDGVANVNVAGTNFPIELFSEPWASPSSVIGAARYDLDLWGHNRAIGRALLSDRAAAAVDAQQARLALVSALVTLYSQFDYAFARRDLLEHKVRDAGRRHAISGERARRGLDNGYDAEATRAADAALQAQLQHADDAITQLRLQMGVLAGSGPERGLALARPKMAEPAGATLPPTLPLDLLGRRPDIVAARLRVDAAGGRIDAARAQFYPNINLLAVTGFSSLNVNTLFSRSSITLAAGPALSLPLFERPRLQAQLRAEEANADTMVALYNKTLDEALGEVARSILALNSAEGLARRQAQVVAARERMAQIADERHRRGLLTRAEQLAAQAALLDEQLRMAALQAQRRDAWIALIRALGGGFDINVNGRNTHA